jgi:D-galactarolactone cycloisomerase
MKIVAAEIYLIRVKCDTGAPPRAFAGLGWATLDTLLLRLDTDQGITGWGEGFGHAACPATRAALATQVVPALIGADARDIRGLMRRLAERFHLFGRNGPLVYALSAVDIALWDIAGKQAGQPLWRLLGGAPRTHLSAYASLLRYEEPAAVADAVGRAVRQGYAAVKLHETGLAQVRAAREAGGAALRLMLDTNCPWTVDQAIAMARALRDCQIDWLEEPVWPPEDHAGLARVRREGGVPIAAGENAAGLHDFRHLFEAGALDIAQPSVAKIGGVTEVVRIAALADAFAVCLVPHCAYFGPGYLASLHLQAVLAPDAPFERLFLDLEASPYHDRILARNGQVAVPDGPGLGCDPDPDVLRRFAI